MTFRCPRGHESTDPDYCSVCGIAMTGASASAGSGSAPAMSTAVGGAPSATGGSTATATVCPVCSTPRTDMSLRFCEVCRYDFQTGIPAPGSAPATPTPMPTPMPPSAQPPSASRPPVSPGPDDPNDPFAAEFAALEAAAAGGSPDVNNAATVVSAPPAPASLPTAKPPPLVMASAPLASTAVTPTGPMWEVRVSVDPSLDTDPDPDLPVPTDEPDYFFPLTDGETLIGRRDDQQGVHPQIPLRDPGVSRRHAMLRRDADGISVMDLDSTNGTMVNNTELPPDSRRLLKNGDEITVGRWTRITLRSVNA